MKTALIVGAGFSCEAGLPTTNEVVETFLETPRNGALDPHVNQEISRQLTKFWNYVFRYSDGNPRPSLEDHFTVLDLAANTGRNIGSQYTPRKLRAIRRLSIHRVFEILDRRYKHSSTIERLLASIRQKSGLTVVSTNWDTVVENHMRAMQPSYCYGLPIENLDGTDVHPEGTKLLMLHGSANWIYCDACRRLYAGEPGHGKAALQAAIYINADDFRQLCPDNQMVLDLVSEIPRQAKHCVHCNNRLGARIATFSYRKEVSIPQFQTVWQEAFCALRDSDTWFFIGYSLPEADFEFRHLLKSAEKAARGNTAKDIQVILKNNPDAGQRFRRFFGITEDRIYQHGLSEWARNCLPGWLGL